MSSSLLRSRAVLQSQAILRSQATTWNLRAWAAFLVVAACATLAAQAPATTPSPQPVFRSGVELVRLDVRVTDASGRAVQDLRADEMEVSEGGTRRPVLLFQHVAEPSGTYLEVARRTVGGEVSTNQGAPRGHLYVLVFDEAHITTGNEQRARVAAERFLRTRFRPGDRVALYALPGPGPQMNFSARLEQVLAALPGVRGTYDRALTATGGAMSAYEAYSIVRGNATVLRRVALRLAGSASDTDLKGAATEDPEAAKKRLAAPIEPRDLERTAAANASTVIAREDADARQFLLSLSDIVRNLATIEGRKTVALFSEGFYADNVVHEVERLAAAAAQAYAVVYAFDLNRRGIDIAAQEALGSDAQADIQNRVEPLGTMATDTDGRVVFDATAHMDQALAQMADDTQDYYVVGFEPSPAALGDRETYRRVSVRVSRPGVTVHARTGYSLRDPKNVPGRRAAIDAALAAPFPQQGFPLELTTYVLRGDGAGSERVVLSLSAEVPLRSDDATRADIVFAVRSASDGRTVASGTDTMPLPSAARAGATTGIGRYTVQFNLASGQYLMRAVVREPDGAVASADRRFDVAAFESVDMAASDLIIGSQTGPLPTRAAVAVDEGLSAALEVYARRAADLDRVEVFADLGRIGEETTITSVKADLRPIKPLVSGASRAAHIDLPLTGVAPGQYAVHAVVKAGGETVAELAREVLILPAGARVERPAVATERRHPAALLGGEVGRRFISALGDLSDDAAVSEAARCSLAGDWAKAEKSLQGAPAGYAASALRGLALFARERYSESTAELQRALTLESSVHDARLRAMSAFLRGWVQAYAGNQTEAITAWRSAIGFDSSLVPAYLALADAYVQQSQRPLALQVIRSGLAAVPQSLELQSKLIEIR